jgi:hypothetical protein
MRFLYIILITSILLTSGLHQKVSVNGGYQTKITAAAPRKRALLVGVSSYCRGGDSSQCSAGGRYWWDLNSGPDVAALETVLKDKFGFDEIKVLRIRDETTHASIVNTFRSFLVEKTNKGDIVYFHFSGHGTQVPDDDKHGPNPDKGDEIDGLDEALVPSDYVTQDDNSNNMRDDEISRLLAELKAKGPANVTVTMDSCFSGSNTRGGDSLVRGGRWRGKVPAAPPAARPDGPGGLLPSGGARSQGFTVLSATRNDQLAFEMEDEGTRKEMGTFTHALTKALEEAGPGTTYRDLIERITDTVTRRRRNQEPQIEGDRDLLLMSGVPVRPPQPYVQTEVRRGKVLLMAGRLQWVTPGSQFAIYALGADPKSSQPLAKAVVESVQTTTSELKITEPVVSDKLLESLNAARAVETVHSFGDLRLKVATQDLQSTAEAREIVERLKVLDLVSPTTRGHESWDVRVCSNNCPNEILPAGEQPARYIGGFTLQRSDGSIIAKVAGGAGAVEGISVALEREARWYFIKGLNSRGDPDVQIKMRLVPVADVEVSPANGLASKVRKLGEEVLLTEGGQIEVFEGDYLMLEIMNLGTTDVWVSVLDINSEGGIGPLWPHPEVPVGLSGENRIPAARDGKPVWTPVPLPFVIRITKPYGWESFKAIATLNKTNFSLLFQPEISEGIQRGKREGRSESQAMLGQILMTGTTGLSRKRGVVVGADPSNVVAPSNWATATVTFLVKPKN